MAIYKNTALAAAIILACSVAHAQSSWFQLEAGVGVSHYNDSDGLWINEGLPHDSHFTTPAWRAGIQFNVVDHAPGSFVPGLAMHLAYLNFGHESIRSLAAPDKDATFNDTTGGYYNPATHSCAGPCGPLRDFVSGGTLQAVALTAEPFWMYRKWRFGLEAGPALWRGTWSATATSITKTAFWGPAGSVETFQHTPKWEIGALTGVSVSYGAISLRYNYIFAKTHNYSTNSVPPGWSGAHMLTLNYTY